MLRRAVSAYPFTTCIHSYTHMLMSSSLSSFILPSFLSLSGPGTNENALKWVNCDTYGWGEHFNNLPFFNARGIYVFVGNDVFRPLCHVQFWAAGLGVNCGNHDHHELVGEKAFCETHVTLYNGSGEGGMVFLKRKEEERKKERERDREVYLPVAVGNEHGPLWEVDAKGMPVRREDGSVVYGTHRWQAGGRRRDSARSERYDVWAAFELRPEDCVSHE